MFMLAMIPARMITAPTTTSIHPKNDRPLKKIIPIPSSSGMSVRPKEFCPQKFQKPVVTVTREVSRYAPAHASATPITNSTIPPGVPPAPRAEWVSSKGELLTGRETVGGPHKYPPARRAAQACGRKPCPHHAFRRSWDADTKAAPQCFDSLNADGVEDSPTRPSARSPPLPSRVSARLIA